MLIPAHLTPAEVTKVEANAKIETANNLKCILLYPTKMKWQICPLAKRRDRSRNRETHLLIYNLRPEGVKQQGHVKFMARPEEGLTMSISICFTAMYAALDPPAVKETSSRL